VRSSNGSYGGIAAHLGADDTARREPFALLGA
jgi:hypothetical protein